MTIKMFRNSLITEMHQDYVRTAFSRGNSPGRVLICHAFRNGILPVITFLGVAIADIISKRDYPVVEAIIVLIAVVILVINMITDLMYKVLDKRIEI